METLYHTVHLRQMTTAPMGAHFPAAAIDQGFRGAILHAQGVLMGLLMGRCH
jgi:hypothetical protein